MQEIDGKDYSTHARRWIELDGSCPAVKHICTSAERGRSKNLESPSAEWLEVKCVQKAMGSPRCTIIFHSTLIDTAKADRLLQSFMIVQRRDAEADAS